MDQKITLRKSILIFTCSCSCLTSCGDKSGSNTPVPVSYDKDKIFTGQFMNIDDVKPLAIMDELTAEQVLNYVVTFRDAYQTYPSESVAVTPKPDIQKCVDKIIDGTKAERGEQYFRTNFEADFSACFPAVAEKLATSKMFYALACSGGDFSANDDVSNLDWASVGIKPCKNARGDILVQENQIARQALNSKQGLIVHKTSMEVYQKSSGGPCESKYDDGTLTMEDCTFIQAVNYTDANEAPIKTTTLLRFDMRNLISKSGDAGYYYYGGTIDVMINNWQGVVTYKEDGSKPALFVMTDGTNSIAVDLLPN